MSKLVICTKSTTSVILYCMGFKFDSSSCRLIVGDIDWSVLSSFKTNHNRKRCYANMFYERNMTMLMYATHIRHTLLPTRTERRQLKRLVIIWRDFNIFCYMGTLHRSSQGSRLVYFIIPVVYRSQVEFYFDHAYWHHHHSHNTATKSAWQCRLIHWAYHSRHWIH